MAAETAKLLERQIAALERALFVGFGELKATLGKHSEALNLEHRNTLLEAAEQLGGKVWESGTCRNSTPCCRNPASDKEAW